MSQLNLAIEEKGKGQLFAGLVGRNILASRSPWLHQEEARAQGIDLTYHLFDFTARGWSDADLPRLLDSAQAAGFSGLNITHPFKQAVLGHLDSLSPAAVKVGAVNSVQFIDRQRIGHNTDVTGFAQSVQRGLSGQALSTLVQFGAGGGGSATAHALLELGAQDFTLVDADSVRRTALAAHLADHYPHAIIRTRDTAPSSFDGVDGIVNATPVGMASYPGTPFDTHLLSSAQWVADIVYFPLETQLLKAARALGCATLAGSGMAVFQAADAFDIFTGLTAKRERMVASFDRFDCRPPLAGAA